MERYFSSEKDQNSLTSNFVNCVFKDSENGIWVGTDSAGLSKYDTAENKFTRYFYADKHEGIKSVTGIAEYTKSILVLATKDGLRFFDKKACKFIEMEGVSDTLKNTTISSMYKNSDKEIWLGVYFNALSSALVKLEISSGSETCYFPTDKNPDAILNEKILTIFKDKSGVMWTGTYGKGLNYFNSERSNFFHLKKDESKPNSLSNEYVYSILEDSDESVWIGTSDKWINHYFPSTGKIECIGNDYLIYKITAMANASDGQLWIGSNSKSNPGLILFDKKTKKSKNFICKPNDENYLNDNHVKSILCDGPDVWIATVYGGLNMYNVSSKKFRHFTHNISNEGSIASNEVNDIFKDKNGRLWVATTNGLDMLDLKTESFVHYKYDPKDSNSLSNNYALCINQDKQGNMWVGTSLGLNKFDLKANKFSCYTVQNGLPDNYIYGVLEDDKGFLWISTNSGLSKFDPHAIAFKNFGISDGLQSKEFNTHAFYKGKSGSMYFGGINGLNIFSPDSVKFRPVVPDILVTSFKVFGKEVVLDTAITYIKNITLDYGQNFLSFEFASVDYLFPDKNEFACKMEGFDKDWIQLGQNHNVSYSNLDPGEYTLRVKGTNNDGVWNEKGTSIHIIILPPFYKTMWFYCLCVFILGVSAFVFHKMRVKSLIKTKQILETQVKERTMEIRAQKDEIEAKNKDITDSINYARRIQNAILTSDHYIKKCLPDFFVLYKPKDIISGDFYWIHKTDDHKVYTVIADCTGHGVPGAFMSLIGASKLNEIILEKKITDPAQILNQLREVIINSLNPEGAEVESQDGMDIVICCYDFEKMTLNFACANNPLWIFREDELMEFKPDKMPVGKYSGETKPFTLQTVQLKLGDIVISFTDGYADQFGGPKGKKFKYKQLQEILLSNKEKSLDEVKHLLSREFENWRGVLEQVDDVLVMAVKV